MLAKGIDTRTMTDMGSVVILQFTGIPVCKQPRNRVAKEVLICKEI